MDTEALMFTFMLATPVLIIMVITSHTRKLKKLEIEKLKIEKANMEAEVDAAVQKHLGSLASRVEVVEAIVTDHKYELNEKIKRLK